MLKAIFLDEFSHLFKRMRYLYLLCMIFALAARALSLLEGKAPIWDFTSGFAHGGMFVLFISILVINVLFLWKQFLDHNFKEKAYFYLTLPASETDLILSKFFCTLLSLLISITIVLFSYWISLDSQDQGLIEIILMQFQTTKSQAFWMIVELGILFWLQTSSLVFLGDLAICLGYSRPKKQSAWSFMYGVLFYVLQQALSVGLVLLASLFSSDIRSILFFGGFNGSAMDSFQILAVLVMVIYVLTSVFWMGLCFLKLRKGINVLI